MKQIADHLYSRGKAGNLYCRVRIPQKLLKAYPRKKEVVRSLRTSDVREGKRLLVTELASIFQEFSIKEKKLAIQAAQRAERSAQRLTTLTDEQVNSIASNWVHQALLGDDYVRSHLGPTSGPCIPQLSDTFQALHEPLPQLPVQSAQRQHTRAGRASRPSRRAAFALL